MKINQNIFGLPLAKWPLDCHSYIGGKIIKAITPEQILKEYSNYIEITAKHYSKKGIDYDEAYNQIYLFMLENFPTCKNPTELKYCVRNEMRNYYRKEIKERHIKYGINPENIGL